MQINSQYGCLRGHLVDSLTPRYIFVSAYDDRYNGRLTAASAAQIHSSTSAMGTNICQLQSEVVGVAHELKSKLPNVKEHLQEIKALQVTGTPKHTGWDVSMVKEDLQYTLRKHFGEDGSISSKDSERDVPSMQVSSFGGSIPSHDNDYYHKISHPSNLNNDISLCNSYGLDQPYFTTSSYVAYPSSNRPVPYLHTRYYSAESYPTSACHSMITRRSSGNSSLLAYSISGQHSMQSLIGSESHSPHPHPGSGYHTPQSRLGEEYPGDNTHVYSNKAAKSTAKAASGTGGDSAHRYHCLYPGCSYAPKRQYDLDRHMKTHFPPPPEGELYDCPGKGCGRTGRLGFRRKDHMNEHLSSYHMVDPKTGKKRQSKA